jgi:hypothetical protein
MGFVVVLSDTEVPPCTLGEAMLMNEAGSTFSSYALARITAIRLAFRPEPP